MTADPLATCPKCGHLPDAPNHQFCDTAERMSGTPPTLATVERNAAAARIATEDRDAAIREAAKTYSLRIVATAAGVSHQTVKNILDRA